MPDAMDPDNHNLRNQVAIVSGHAQLLRRDAARLAGLANADRARLLARVGATEAAAAVMAALIGPKPDGAGGQRTAESVTLFTWEVGGDPEAAAALAATGVFATPLVVAGDRAFLAYPRDRLAEEPGFRRRCRDVEGERRYPN